MQAFYAARFVREMGCVEAEWLRWLPDAIGAHPWTREDAVVRVSLPEGGLTLSWRPLEPLRLGLVRMPRLEVSFSFSGLDDGARWRFMRRFDLYMQRGGG